MLSAFEKDPAVRQPVRPARAFLEMFRVPPSVYGVSTKRAFLAFATIHVLLLSLYAATTQQFHVLSIFYILNLDQLFGRPSTAVSVAFSVVTIGVVGGIALAISGREHAERDAT